MFKKFFSYTANSKVLTKNYLILIVGLLFLTQFVWTQKSVKKNSEKAAQKDTKDAYFAAGCFWGVQSLFDDLPGVISTYVGYANGDIENPKYEDVKTGTTNFAETVKVTFDANVISYKELLIYFFKIHDPTTLNKQGVDEGTQYRSAIFTVSDDQQKIATELSDSITRQKVFERPISTIIEPLRNFFDAEDYHQKYFSKHNASNECHFVRDLKITF